MKATEKLERKINKLIAENESAKADIQARMAKAEADKAEGQKALDAAAEMNDDAAYHAAKEKIRFASDSMEMCSNRLDVLNASVCSRAEYEEMLNAIQNASFEAEQAAEKKAAPLVAELCKLAEELDRTIEENNALCAKWCSASHDENCFNHYFNRNTSEMLYLGKTIRNRKNSTQNLYNNGKGSLDIYELITD